MAPTSGGPGVFIRSKRRQLQELEGAQYLAPPASTENEGSSKLFQEVWIYADLQAGSEAIVYNAQPDPESVTIVELPIGSGEVVEEEHAVTINEVRAQTVILIHHRDYGSV